MDVRDWMILFHINAFGMAATAFIFLHPDTANFVTWAGVLGSIIAAYHWISYKDSKVKDATQ